MLFKNCWLPLPSIVIVILDIAPTKIIKLVEKKKIKITKGI